MIKAFKHGGLYEKRCFFSGCFSNSFYLFHSVCGRGKIFLFSEFTAFSFDSYDDSSSSSCLCAPTYALLSRALYAKTDSDPRVHNLHVSLLSVPSSLLPPKLLLSLLDFEITRYYPTRRKTHSFRGGFYGAWDKKIIISSANAGSVGDNNLGVFRSPKHSSLERFSRESGVFLRIHSRS